MSSDADIAIIQSKVSQRLAIDIVERSLDLLLEHYDFGFRSYGGVLGLDFQGTEYLQERELDDGPSSASAIDRQEIERLVRQERWFSIGGSIRIPEVARLIDLDLILYPTFDHKLPACGLFRLEHDLYDCVWRADGSFNEDAASALFKLSVSLGANELVDGFQAMLIADLGEVRPFDGPDLLADLVHPRSALEIAANPHLRRGFVTGLRNTLVSISELKQKWRDAEISETTNGFIVLSRLIDFSKPKSHGA